MDAGPSSYKVGDSVWVKIPHGRCTTQFGKGTITGVYSPHSVLVDGTPRHVKDVRRVRGADITYCSSASSEDEAPMLYLPWEDCAASESNHSDHGQRGPGDTSEDDDVVESVPLRWSSRLKRPAPRCTLCDSQIREECEGNVPGHSKRASNTQVRYLHTFKTHFKKKTLYIGRHQGLLAYEQSESTWDNFGKFIHQFQPETTYQETWKDLN